MPLKFHASLIPLNAALISAKAIAGALITLLISVTVPVLSTGAPEASALAASTGAEQKEQQAERKVESLLMTLDPESPEAARTVSSLIQAVRSERTRPETRRRAAMMLARIGKPARAAIPVLIDLVGETEGSGSTPTEPGSSERSSPEPESGSIKSPAAESTPGAACPSESNPSAFEPRSPTGSPNKFSTSYWAMKSLGLFGTVAEEAVPVLRRILHDRSQPHERRIVAADALGQIATPAAIGALSEELLRPAGSESYKQSLLRQVMIDGLWLAGPQAAGALLALSRATEDPNAEVRRKACRAIGAIGPQAAGVVSVLFDRLILDDVPAVKDAAAEAMSQVGPSAVPLLVRVLEGGDANLQWQAAQALGNTGEYADPAIPSLRRALHADDSRVRLQAADALLRVAGDRSGVRKEVAATALEEITAAGRQQRRHAAELLISMNPLPSSTRQPLTRLAGNPSSPGSRTAAYIFRERKRRQNPSAGR